LMGELLLTTAALPIFGAIPRRSGLGTSVLTSFSQLMVLLRVLQTFVLLS
jgi:hypothetical protein